MAFNPQVSLCRTSGRQLRSAQWCFRQSSKVDDRVYLATISRLLHRPKSTVVSAHNPLLCRLRVRLLRKARALHGKSDCLDSPFNVSWMAPAFTANRVELWPLLDNCPLRSETVLSVKTALASLFLLAATPSVLLSRSMSPVRYRHHPREAQLAVEQ